MILFFKLLLCIGVNIFFIIDLFVNFLYIWFLWLICNVISKWLLGCGYSDFIFGKFFYGINILWGNLIFICVLLWFVLSILVKLYLFFVILGIFWVVNNLFEWFG